MIKRRFTKETKQQLIVLINWLGAKGYDEATRKIMEKISLSYDELAEWRKKYEMFLD